MNDEARFLFVVCQVGVESTLKAEIARHWPDLRWSFSRPGFATFKIPAEMSLVDDFDLRSTFARTYGFSLGKVQGTGAVALAQELWRQVGDRRLHGVHVWQRDARIPGERGFEPGATPLAEEVGATIVAQRPPSSEAPLPLNRVVRPGAIVLDCVLVEPGEWWFGYHRAASLPSRWPGGVPPIQPPPATVSRTYWKAVEALAWSRFPIRAGQCWAEIGSSPGGACQALLERDLQVIGIDPAEMDSSILEHPHFQHIRKRAAEVRRREFRGVKWLLADANVAPDHTLESVESIVTHPDVHIRGLLLTLKLATWEFAPRIAECVQRIRQWGFQSVKTRQLAFNRREICVAALRRRSMRREPPWKKSRGGDSPKDT